MDIFESLENLNVSEECFEDIVGIVEELILERNKENKIKKNEVQYRLTNPNGVEASTSNIDIKRLKDKHPEQFNSLSNAVKNLKDKKVKYEENTSTTSYPNTPYVTIKGKAPSYKDFKATIYDGKDKPGFYDSHYEGDDGYWYRSSGSKEIRKVLGRDGKFSKPGKIEETPVQTAVKSYLKAKKDKELALKKNQ